MSKYTLSRESAEAKIRALVDSQGDHAAKWQVYISPDLMIASPPAGYRLTFQSGGATARKSRRSDRWHITYGIG